MRHEKFCFDKKMGIISLVGIVFVFMVLASQTLTSTQTSTNSRASEPKSAAQGGETWFGVPINAGKKCSTFIGCKWNEREPYNVLDYTSYGHCSWLGITYGMTYCRSSALLTDFAAWYGGSPGSYIRGSHAYCVAKGYTKCAVVTEDSPLLDELSSDAGRECPYFEEPTSGTTDVTIKDGDTAAFQNDVVKVKMGICQ